MNFNTRTRTVLCMALIVAVAACAKKEEGSEIAAAPVVPQASTARESAAPAATTVTAASSAEQMGSSAATYVDAERKFIRTASARFGVKDVYVAALGIEDIVASHGGFVVKNDIETESMSTRHHAIGNGKLLELHEYKVQAHLIVRVPSAKTQEFMRAIAGHVAFLDQRTFSAQDAQFALLRQQLAVQRNQEAQTELGQAVEDGGKLGQKSDAIVARNDVRAARDAALLAKKEFEDQVAFSTIELKLHQPSRVLQTERVDVESIYRNARPGFLVRLGENLRGGWDGLLEFILVLGSIWPVVLVAALIGTVVWRIKRSKRAAAVKAQ